MAEKRTLLTVASILVVLGVGGAGALAAKTPDGQTPSEETVCDIFGGAAFGLCNAYCEAMDCELLTDGDPSTSPNASEKACMRVKANFVAKTGMPMLPCEVDDCPEGELGCPCFPDGRCGAGECDDSQDPPTCEEPP